MKTTELMNWMRRAAAAAAADKAMMMMIEYDLDLTGYCLQLLLLMMPTHFRPPAAYADVALDGQFGTLKRMRSTRMTID